MSPDELSYRRFPRVPIKRRVGAFLIDFVTVWFVSSFFGNSIQWLIFILGWLVMRVVVVDKNQGQSLGSWALDLKVIDARFNKIPDLVVLGKREGILGFAAVLAMYGLEINLRNGLSMLLLLTPLLVDCGIAFADEELNQAFHDRLASTIVIQTPRGYSLDLRLKKLLAQIKNNMRKY
ncbi:RDD domain containing protein [Stanieria cyanosphaera PCC 7437]|uniref:RDD domain containing protein n=1 Tax=Stanieria cyanosphaera (strain ATCC 29371 / PCC 7437) TaxID=111780 RepID=K9XXG1_STAC7|nr:RDD family protein [Stanieria cyanosphaera]AFZ36786.1 RDD domain containing protein [Stanieria cyanosphaera PCC 7437]